MEKRRKRRLRGRAVENLIRQLRVSAMTNETRAHNAERRASRAEANARYAGEAAVSDFIMRVCDPMDSKNEFFRAITDQLMREAGSAFGKQLLTQMDAYRPIFQTEKRIVDAVLHMAMLNVKMDAIKSPISQAYDIRIHIPPITYAYRLNVPT